MSIMTDGEIVAALDAGEIVITPIGSRLEQIQPCSVDLRLSREVMVYTQAPDERVRLGQRFDQQMENVNVGAASHFLLKPGAFALGVTMERVKLPPNILGRVEGRSSIGRAGLFVHITAGFIDPGFDGRITLEFYNGSPRTIEIPFGFRVCQLALQRLAVPCVRPYGKARGSKYVGEASASVQPACEERDETITMLLAKKNPPAEIEHYCVQCGHDRASFHYEWLTGDRYYACAKCNERVKESSKRWTTNS